MPVSNSNDCSPGHESILALSASDTGQVEKSTECMHSTKAKCEPDEWATMKSPHPEENRSLISHLLRNCQVGMTESGFRDTESMP